MVAGNLSTMLATKNQDIKNATHLAPLTAQGVATKLQGGMTGKILISHDEQSRVLSQQTAFYVSAVDAVLRELVQHGLMVSKLANETKHHRAEVSGLAQALGKLLDEHGPQLEDSGNTTTTATRNATASNDDTNFDTASNMNTLSSPAINDTASNDSIFRLPGVFLHAVDPEAHARMCKRYMPEFAETLAERAEEKAAAAYKLQVRAEVKEEMGREFQKSLTTEYTSS